MVKFKTKVKRAIQTAAVLGFAFFSSGCRTTGKLEECEGYKAQTQIVEDAKLFNADLSVAHEMAESSNNNKYVLRLKNNGDEPIYVYIDGDFRDSTTEIIKNVFDYFEDTFEDINDKYRFEYVSKSTLKEKIKEDKSTIQVLNKDLEKGVNAYASFPRYNLWDGGGVPLFTTEAKIEYDEDKHDGYLGATEERFYTILHELCHIFGFGEIYTKDEWKHTKSEVINFNSIMRSDSRTRSMNVFKPEDYKLLFAMYYEDHLTENGIDTEKVEYVRNLINEYEKEYYTVLTKSYQYDQIELKTEELYSSYINYKIQGREYRLKINEGEYELQVFTDNGIKSYKGKTIRCGETLILKNITVDNYKEIDKDSFDMPAIFDMVVYYTHSKYLQKTFFHIETLASREPIFEKDVTIAPRLDLTNEDMTY